MNDGHQFNMKETMERVNKYWEKITFASAYDQAIHVEYKDITNERPCLIEGKRQVKEGEEADVSDTKKETLGDIHEVH